MLKVLFEILQAYQDKRYLYEMLLTFRAESGEKSRLYCTDLYADMFLKIGFLRLPLHCMMMNGKGINTCFFCFFFFVFFCVCVCVCACACVCVCVYFTFGLMNYRKNKCGSHTENGTRH